MTRDHSTIEELLAVQALGGLDGDDVQALARERAEHGDCEECTRLEAEFADTAGRMAFSLDPEPVDMAMADRILADAREDTPVVLPEAVPRQIPPSADGPGSRERRGRAWQAIVGIAAAFAILVVAVAVFGPGRTTEVTGASPVHRIVSFEGASEGELAMAYTPGIAGAVIWGSNMPDPGADKVYEIWMIQDGAAVSGGCVLPQDGRLALRVDQDLGASQAMAVTVEPSDCPGQPTTTPIMTADLTVA